MPGEAFSTDFDVSVFTYNISPGDEKMLNLDVFGWEESMDTGAFVEKGNNNKTMHRRWIE